MSLYLGIDGGGTSCKAACCDDDGNVIWEGRGGPTNWTTTPRESFLDHLQETLQGCPAPEAVAGCFAGVLSVGDQSNLFQYLNQLFPTSRVVVEPDYAAAFMACSPGTSACIISGTGSVVVSHLGFGRSGNSSSWHVGGGGGALLGDVGSAFDLVRMGLRHLVFEGGRYLPPRGGGADGPPAAEGVDSLEATDPHPLGGRGAGAHNPPPRGGGGEERAGGGVPSTRQPRPLSSQDSDFPLPEEGDLLLSFPHLAAALRARFGTLDRPDLTRAIYACPSPQAELAALIGELGKDTTQNPEFQREVQSSFRTLLDTARRLTQGTHFGLVGGVWDAHPIFLDLMTELTKVPNGPYENVTIAKAEVPPVIGAVRLAKNLMQ